MILTDVSSCINPVQHLLEIYCHASCKFSLTIIFFAEMAWMRLSNGQSNALKTDENIIPNGKTHHEKVNLFSACIYQ